VPKTIQFTVPGLPVAKARPKHRAIHTGVFFRNPKTGKQQERVISQTYTPEESANFENLVRVTYLTVCNAAPTDACVSVRVKAFFPLSKSARSWEKIGAQREILPHVKKPDQDNVLKAVLDGLNTVAFTDDSRVFDSRCTKLYSERPRTEVVITIYTMEEILCQSPSPSPSARTRPAPDLSSARSESPTSERIPSATTSLTS